MHMNAEVSRISTPVTELLGIRYPIVQGGLARIARADLAAAVSNAGGLGQITIGGLAEPDLLRAEIRKARAMCALPFGVNFPVGHLEIGPLLDVALEEDVALVSFTGGNPKPYIPLVKQTKAKILILVAGPEQAKKSEQAGADLIATVGYEGGGHLGRTDLTTMVSVPLVAKAVSIPVLAGGGIADGHGLVAALALGAHGVEIGTRFIAVREAYAHQNYKDRIVTTRENDTVIIKRTIGTPGRALNNARAQQVIAAENAGATREEVLGMVRAEANERGVIEGDMDDGLLWAGQSAALVDDIPTVAELMHRIVTEAQQRATGIMHMFKAG